MLDEIVCIHFSISVAIFRACNEVSGCDNIFFHQTVERHSWSNTLKTPGYDLAFHDPGILCKLQQPYGEGRTVISYLYIDGHCRGFC